MFPFRRKKQIDVNDVSPARLEAFSDGVIAIIITIMALELKVPHDAGMDGLWHLWPIFFSYAVSFFFIATYWLNHHHLLHFVKHIDNAILWTNLFFLFCLSLIPFFTANVGENGIAVIPTMLYAGIMLVCSFSFTLLRLAVARAQTGAGLLKLLRIAGTGKNIIAFFIYMAAIPLAMINPLITLGLILAVALAYVVPPKWDKNPYRSEKD